MANKRIYVDYMLAVFMIFLGLLTIFCDGEGDTDPGNDPGDSTTTLTAEANGPYTGYAGIPVEFSAAGSDNPNGGTYTWDFGYSGAVLDTSTSITSVAHTYGTAGSYTVTLTVEAISGNTGTDTTYADIDENEPPTVDHGGPYSGLVNEEITFDASGTTDPEGQSMTYEWDFEDDGTIDASGTDLRTTSHTYDTAGNYTVALTVDDGFNPPVTVDTTANITADPTNDPPVADIGGHEPGYYWALPGVPVSFDGGGSSDPNGDSLDYTWDFGDGNSDTGETASNTYDTVGTYTVTLTVDDGEFTDDDTADIVFVEQSLPDTGQENCYSFSVVDCSSIDPDNPDPDSYAYGQDAQYGDNVPDLTAADPIVTDNKTGLVWEMDGNGGATIGHPAAETHCSGLTYDGASPGDWRLPTRRELLTIASYGHTNPAIYPATFTNIGFLGSYWTSTPVASDISGDKVWPVSFYDGWSTALYSPNGLSKSTGSGYVRCVKGPEFLPDVHDFEIMADGTITDWDTGLNWQAPASVASMNWFRALYYCEKEAIPIGDWRLPNAKELESLLSLNWYDPALDLAVFADDDTDVLTGKYYWTSTSDVMLGGLGGWQIEVKSGDVTSTTGKDAYEGYVRCVRKMPDEK